MKWSLLYYKASRGIGDTNASTSPRAQIIIRSEMSPVSYQETPAERERESIIQCKHDTGVVNKVSAS